MVYKRQNYLAKVKGFHYWPPKFNSKDSAFVFVLELFVLFLSLKQEMEQEMDNNILKKINIRLQLWYSA